MTDLTTLQNIIFPQNDICSEDSLYFRADQGTYDEHKRVLYVKNKVSFDTYFNIFSVKKYKEYSRPLALFLRVRVCGLFVLRVFGIRKTENGFAEECITEKKTDHQCPEDVVVSLNENLKEDYSQIYFTLEGRGEFYGGAFECECDHENKVNIALVICTFRREKYLLRNYRKIREYLESGNVFHKDNFHIYIVDNGRTLQKEDFQNEYVSLIPNANTGGSGGFTRGYREAAESGKGYTHILFSDDDIVLDCEMLLRIYSLLKLTKEEFSDLAVGGTMLKLSDGITQHEAGAFWNGKRLNSIGNGKNMTVRENVLEAAYYPEGNYNAWWFYCFPADWCIRYGYPLPFFIKEDDIEYSLRCAGHIAVIPGIAVWHEDFEGKYDGFQEYYIKRNELILTTVNHQKPYTLFQLRKLILNVMKQTVLQRYFLADIVFRAYDDYLKGWRHFKHTDTEALNLELMQSCRPLLNDEELKEQYGVYFDEEKYTHSMTEPDNNKALLLTLNGYLIPEAFYQKDKDDFYVVDLAKCRYVNFLKHKRVLHYDKNRKKGFVTVQKKSALLKYILLLIVKSIKFAVKYPFVRREYRKHLDEVFF